MEVSDLNHFSTKKHQEQCQMTLAEINKISRSIQLLFLIPDASIQILQEKLNRIESLILDLPVQKQTIHFLKWWQHLCTWKDRLYYIQSKSVFNNNANQLLGHENVDLSMSDKDEQFWAPWKISILFDQNEVVVYDRNDRNQIMRKIAALIETILQALEKFPLIRKNPNIRLYCFEVAFRKLPAILKKIYDQNQYIHCIYVLLHFLIIILNENLANNQRHQCGTFGLRCANCSIEINSEISNLDINVSSCCHHIIYQLPFVLTANDQMIQKDLEIVSEQIPFLRDALDMKGMKFLHSMLKHIELNILPKLTTKENEKIKFIQQLAFEIIFYRLPQQCQQIYMEQNAEPYSISALSSFISFSIENQGMFPM